MSFKIGNIELKYGLMLAPMAGVTDRAFRDICKKYGAEYTVTEMVSAKALHFNDDESKKLAEVREDETPCAVQIFGHEPDIMAEATEMILNKDIVKGAMPDSIDINMGCPVKKIVTNQDGSALMKNPALAGEIIKAVCKVSTVPVTLKIRTGWNDSSKNAVEIAQIAEENGASMICVHGRTREEMYTPPVDRETIAKVKRAVSIPVVANGGIYTAEDAIRMFEETNCDGLMIARGAMGNPWLFEEIIAAIDGKNYCPRPIYEKISAAIKQVEIMIEDKGERIALLEARRHLAYYIKGEIGSAETRFRLNSSSSFSELKSIIADFLDKLTKKQK